MTTLEEFIPQLNCQDTKKKLQIGSDLINYLSNSSNEISCENFGAFIDSMVQWLHSSNFKVFIILTIALTVILMQIMISTYPFICTHLLFI
jgi:hypothetical protein